MPLPQAARPLTEESESILRGEGVRVIFYIRTFTHLSRSLRVCFLFYLSVPFGVFGLDSHYLIRNHHHRLIVILIRSLYSLSNIQGFDSIARDE